MEFLVTAAQNRQLHFFCKTTIIISETATCDLTGSCSVESKRKVFGRAPFPGSSALIFSLCGYPRRWTASTTSTSHQGRHPLTSWLARHHATFKDTLGNPLQSAVLGRYLPPRPRPPRGAPPAPGTQQLPAECNQSQSPPLHLIRKRARLAHGTGDRPKSPRTSWKLGPPSWRRAGQHRLCAPSTGRTATKAKAIRGPTSTVGVWPAATDSRYCTRIEFMTNVIRTLFAIFVGLRPT